MDPMPNSWTLLPCGRRTFSTCIFLGKYFRSFPSLFLAAQLPWCALNLATVLLPYHSGCRWKSYPTSHLTSYEHWNTYSQQPFFSLFSHIYFTFIGRGSYFLKLPLKTVVTSLPLFLWRKWVITCRAGMISFSFFRCTFFFNFYWVDGLLIVQFSFGLVGLLSRSTF